MDNKQKLKTILKESFLKELIENGFRVFEYSNGVLYYEPDCKKHKIKSNIEITRDEAMSLLKKIADQFSESLDRILHINEGETRILIMVPPEAKDIYFYFDIGK